MAATMFTSARLTYRAVEDTPEDLDFIDSIAKDAEGFANSNIVSLRPQSKEAAKQWRKDLTETCLLGVLICLPSPSTTTTTTTTTSPEGQPPQPIGILALNAPTAPTKTHHRNASVAIDIHPSHQRRGYGAEALRWVLAWGFDYQGLHRISIESFSHNEGAGRLYERLGFVAEGRRREAVWFRGGWRDFVMFGMLEGEWRERRGRGE